ncbi:MAG: hypothetical protein AB1597_04170 [Chloroflexota bacterium]
MKGTPHERNLPEVLAGYPAMARFEGTSRDYLEAISTAVIGLVFLPLFVWWFGSDISYIVYSMALPLFLVLRNITKFKRELGTEHGRRNFVIDHDFTPWQTIRKRG